MTLEDLMRIKRSERPRPEFWSEFDQELRQKQLAAIVHKRPRFPAFQFSRAFWSRFSLGAVAVIAVSLVLTRERPAAGPSDQSPALADTVAVDDRPDVAVVAAPAAPAPQTLTAAVEPAAMPEASVPMMAALPVSTNAAAPENDRQYVASMLREVNVGDAGRFLESIGLESPKPVQSSPVVSRVLAALQASPVSDFGREEDLRNPSISLPDFSFPRSVPQRRDQPSMFGLVKTL